MNMGQRRLQLNNTYTFNSNSYITPHFPQVPHNPALLAPGPPPFWDWNPAYERHKQATRERSVVLSI